MKIFRALPDAHKGRSEFIVSALEEKISKQKPRWKPTNERGRELAALLEAGAAERGEPLDEVGLARELKERRGSLH
jgi:hypothetical protein